MRPQWLSGAGQATQISYDSGRSERTVRLHRHRLIDKLKARSLADLAVIAERLGLLSETGDLLGHNGVRAHRLTQAASGSAQ